MITPIIKSKNNIFEISDQSIKFELRHLVITGNSVRHKEFLVDILSKYYKGQIIKFIAWDGQNLYFSGMLEFIRQLQQMFSIPNSNIEFCTATFGPPGYKHNRINYNIFKETGLLLDNTDNKVIDNLQAAKFVGVFNSGRTTLNRLLMSYEIGTAFPDDYYMTQHPDVENTLKWFGMFDDLYAKEIDWFKQRKFLEPDTSFYENSQITDWRASVNSYSKTKDLYAIDVVMETDEFDNSWLTEKSAKVLASGKPFVILSGKGILRVLQDFGFKTFSDVIDESYDQIPDPYGRIRGIIKSLTELYTSPDKNEKILKMYEIAEYNKQAYIIKQNEDIQFLYAYDNNSI